jgi:uncharacterized membrane protein
VTSPAPSVSASGLGTPELTIARLLVIGIDAAIGLIAIGTLLLLADGRSPLDRGSTFDLAAIPADLLALRPDGFLWLGIIAILATSVAQVIVALTGFARRGDRRMALTALGILAIIGIGVITGSVAT